MGVTGNIIILSKMALLQIPSSMAKHLFNKSIKGNLGGVDLCLICGVELMDWIWDDIILSDEDKKFMIKRMISEDVWMDINREDYNNDKEFFEACMDKPSSNIAFNYWEAYYNNIDCIYVRQRFEL